MKKITWILGLLVTCVLVINTNIKVQATDISNGQGENVTVDSNGSLENTNSDENEELPQKEYALYVNRALNTVTVYEIDENGNEIPYKAMVCSCGRNGHQTPLGTFKTSNYYEWRLLVDGSYGRYAVRFNRHILFHSVPYVSTRPNALELDEYNKLGQGASLGCVRLAVEDVKWIYDNCGPGTKVVVYSDAVYPGPLGKPVPQRVTLISTLQGWDPTDIDINSPYWNRNSMMYQQFDHEAYANRYDDLMAVYGYDKYLLWNHYLNFGLNEGREAVFTE